MLVRSPKTRKRMSKIIAFCKKKGLRASWKLLHPGPPEASFKVARVRQRSDDVRDMMHAIAELGLICRGYVKVQGVEVIFQISRSVSQQEILLKLGHGYQAAAEDPRLKLLTAEIETRDSELAAARERMVRMDAEAALGIKSLNEKIQELTLRLMQADRRNLQNPAPEQVPPEAPVARTNAGNGPIDDSVRLEPLIVRIREPHLLRAGQGDEDFANNLYSMFKLGASLGNDQDRTRARETLTRKYGFPLGWDGFETDGYNPKPLKPQVNQKLKPRVFESVGNSNPNSPWFKKFQRMLEDFRQALPPAAFPDTSALRKCEFTRRRWDAMQLVLTRDCWYPCEKTAFARSLAMDGVPRWHGGTRLAPIANIASIPNFIHEMRVPPGRYIQLAGAEAFDSMVARIRELKASLDPNPPPNQDIVFAVIKNGFRGSLETAEKKLKSFSAGFQEWVHYFTAYERSTAQTPQISTVTLRSTTQMKKRPRANTMPIRYYLFPGSYLDLSQKWNSKSQEEKDEWIRKYPLSSDIKTAVVQRDFANFKKRSGTELSFQEWLDAQSASDLPESDDDATKINDWWTS